MLAPSFVSPNSADTGPRGQAQFWNRLQELGYVDRLTLIAERYYASGDRARLEAMLNEVARSKPDVIVTWTTPAVVLETRKVSMSSTHLFSVADTILRLSVTLRLDFAHWVHPINWEIWSRLLQRFGN